MRCVVLTISRCDAFICHLNGILPNADFETEIKSKQKCKRIFEWNKQGEKWWKMKRPRPRNKYCIYVYPLTTRNARNSNWRTKESCKTCSTSRWTANYLQNDGETTTHTIDGIPYSPTHKTQPTRTWTSLSTISESHWRVFDTILFFVSRTDAVFLNFCAVRLSTDSFTIHICISRWIMMRFEWVVCGIWWATFVELVDCWIHTQTVCMRFC